MPTFTYNNCIRDTSTDLIWNDLSQSYVSYVEPVPNTYINPVYSVKLTSFTYKNNQTITSVNLHNVPFVNNSMSEAFLNCSNLTSVSEINSYVNNIDSIFWNCQKMVNFPSIPNNVTSMITSFYNCRSMTDAPIIPNSVTNMFGAFASCNNLVNAPSIPNGVTDLKSTFSYCTSLVDAPIIPPSVTSVGWGGPTQLGQVNGCFSECTNLTGNIYIQSENITNAYWCFYNTSLTKNVYIPFTYENGVNTKTYNAFINAGYKTDGTVNGVYLKDISSNSINYSLLVNGIGTGAVGGVVVDGVSYYNRSGYSGDSGDYSGEFPTGSTVAINWGTEKPDGTPVLEVNGVPEESGNPLSHTFTLTQNTVVNIYLTNTTNVSAPSMEAPPIHVGK